VLSSWARRITGRIRDGFPLPRIPAILTSHNPWDLTRVPGGSSGGSAAAVAADELPGCPGQRYRRQRASTGGFLRDCRYETYLRPGLALTGLVAFASSLDQVGPLTKDVRDNALVLQMIAGYDANDSTSANIPVPDYTASFNIKA